MGSSQSVNHGRSRRRTPVKDKRRAARLRLPASTRSNRDKSDNIYRHTNAVKGSEASPESVTLTLECDLFLGRAGCPSHLQLAVAERSPPATATATGRVTGKVEPPCLNFPPFAKASPQDGGLFYHYKGFKSGETPSICSPSRYPTMTFRPPCSHRRFALSLASRRCAHPSRPARHHGF